MGPGCNNIAVAYSIPDDDSESGYLSPSMDMVVDPQNTEIVPPKVQSCKYSDFVYSITVVYVVLVNNNLSIFLSAQQSTFLFTCRESTNPFIFHYFFHSVQ